MHPALRLSLLLGCSLLAACEQIAELDGSKAAEAEGKATGGACRHAGRALEDCYTLNEKAPRAAVFAGWREMNDYMTQNKIEAVEPVVPPPSPKKTETKQGDAPAAKTAALPDPLAAAAAAAAAPAAARAAAGKAGQAASGERQTGPRAGHAAAAVANTAASASTAVNTVGSARQDAAAAAAAPAAAPAADSAPRSPAEVAAALFAPPDAAAVKLPAKVVAGAAPDKKTH